MTVFDFDSKTRGMGRIWIGVAAIVLLAAFSSFAEPPLHVYLTWQNDTSTTMTVNYQSLEKGSKSYVYFDTVPHGGNYEDYAMEAQGRAHKVPGLVDKRQIHVVELTGLTPGVPYYFIAGNKKKGFTEERKFRTIPAGDGPIRFVTGGDMDISTTTKALLAVAAKQEPRFVIVGGDIAPVRRNMSRI